MLIRSAVPHWVSKQSLVSPVPSLVSPASSPVSPAQSLVSPVLKHVSPAPSPVSPAQSPVSPVLSHVRPEPSPISLVRPAQSPFSPAQSLVSPALSHVSHVVPHRVSRQSLVSPASSFVIPISSPVSPVSPAQSPVNPVLSHVSPLPIVNMTKINSRLLRRTIAAWFPVRLGTGLTCTTPAWEQYKRQVVGLAFNVTSTQIGHLVTGCPAWHRLRRLRTACDKIMHTF